MGERRRLFIDILDGGPGPRRRDYVVSVGKQGIGTIYLVLRSRQVKRRDPSAVPRFSLDVKVVPNYPGTAKIFEFHWYPRKKKTFEDHMKRRTGEF